MSVHTITNNTRQTFPFSPRQPGVTEIFNASGSSELQLAEVTPSYPMEFIVNLASYSSINTVLTIADTSRLTINGDATTGVTMNGVSNLASAQAIIKPAVSGTGTFSLAQGGLLEFSSSVASGITVSIEGDHHGTPATLKVDHGAAFKGTVIFNDGIVELDGLDHPSSFDEKNGVITIYGAHLQVLDRLHVVNKSPELRSFLDVSLSSTGGVIVNEFGSGVLKGPGYSGLPHRSGPGGFVLVHDTTTNADVADKLSHDYTGPVDSLQTEYINISTDSLNITATSPNMFIHTGAGNDAIAAYSGNNVLDGGAGSNFLTGGVGDDTFFVDARGAVSDTWSTVRGFHSGRAIQF